MQIPADPTKAMAYDLSAAVHESLMGAKTVAG
jgi:hypothetical protein